ncbi:Hypothetical predicted protein [Pelobates cultripes]|uniref:Nicotinamide riboside kinase 2 n=1 Tax=Pelobates cultripes TaxID=61616 RepID=A0AAD1S6N9_PELCU|nr:Hypothetical predicted protein [Pelobates cultripes]
MVRPVFAVASSNVYVPTFYFFILQHITMANMVYFMYPARSASYHVFVLPTVITSIDMEAMVNTVTAWVENPVKFARSHGIAGSHPYEQQEDDEIQILILEGFLLYNHKPLAEMCSRRYYLTIPYEECKLRRSGRNYRVPDPPGLFDGHVWPMYLKHRQEMEDQGVAFVSIDGLLSKDDIFNQVYTDVCNKILNIS